MRASPCLVAIAVLGFGSVLRAQCDQGKVLSPFGAAARFGSKVDIAAGPELICAASGVEKATIHRKIAGSWVLEATLSGAAGTQFASDVAIEGTTAVVGVPGSTESGFAGAGSVEIYGDDGTGTWTLRTHLPSPALETDANFGTAVAMDSDWIAVGAPGVAARKGRVYLYRLDALGMPVLTQTIQNSFAFAAAGDEFGHDVDLGLPGLAVGDPNASNGFSKQGFVVLYRMNAAGTSFTSGNGWTLGGTNIHLGQVVAIDGDVAAASSPAYSSNDGIVDGYHWDGTKYQAGLSTDYVGQAKFGAALAVSGNRLFASTPLKTKIGIYPHGAMSYIPYSGTGFTFGTGGLTHVFPPELTYEYGGSAGAGDDLLAVGAPGDPAAGFNAGAVYTYDLSKIGYLTQGLSSSPGIKGSGFIAPSLDLAGSYCDGEGVYIALSTYIGPSMSFLIVGLSDINVPFLGTILTPAPDLLLPIPTDANGDFTLYATLPPGLPPALRLSMQCFIQDAGGPQGYAATPAYEAVLAH